MATVKHVEFKTVADVRKHLRSPKTKGVYAAALMREDIYYVKISKAEALFQLREFGANEDSPISWNMTGSNIYIEPNRRVRMGKEE